jgi:hypothetical protein
MDKLSKIGNFFQVNRHHYEPINLKKNDDINKIYELVINNNINQDFANSPNNTYYLLHIYYLNIDDKLSKSYLFDGCKKGCAKCIAKYCNRYNVNEKFYNDLEDIIKLGFIDKIPNHLPILYRNMSYKNLTNDQVNLCINSLQYGTKFLKVLLNYCKTYKHKDTEKFCQIALEKGMCLDFLVEYYKNDPLNLRKVLDVGISKGDPIILIKGLHFYSDKTNKVNEIIEIGLKNKHVDIIKYVLYKYDKVFIYKMIDRLIEDGFDFKSCIHRFIWIYVVTNYYDEFVKHVVKHINVNVKTFNFMIKCKFNFEIAMNNNKYLYKHNICTLNSHLKSYYMIRKSCFDENIDICTVCNMSKPLKISSSICFDC